MVEQVLDSDGSETEALAAQSRATEGAPAGSAMAGFDPSAIWGQGTTACGMLEFTFDQDICVTKASATFFEMLGFDASVAQKYQSDPSMLDMVLHLTRDALLGVARQIQDGGLPSSADMPRPTSQTFFRRIDGTYVEVSCWVSSFLDDGRYYCVMACVPVSREIARVREHNVADVLRYAADMFDGVFRINAFDNTITCLANHLSEGVKLPCGIPMLLPAALDYWLNAAVEEADRDAVRAFFSVEPVPLSNETRRLSFGVVFPDGPRHYDSIFVGVGGGALVFCNRARDDVKPETPAQMSRAMQLVGGQHVKVRTFGHFDVFVDGEAVDFSSAKAKEYLALLVDRRGGYVSTREAALALWEEEEVSAVTLARARKAAMNMNRTLERYGIGNIVDNAGATRRLRVNSVECDLYTLLAGSEEDRRAFGGTYMCDYSWGEETCAELTFLG